MENDSATTVGQGAATEQLWIVRPNAADILSHLLAESDLGLELAGDGVDHSIPDRTFTCAIPDVQDRVAKRFSVGVLQHVGRRANVGGEPAVC